MQKVIECSDVWKVYRMGGVDVPALRGFNLTVQKGEFIAVMGPSGSGKSTAMNMIGCLDVPTKGNIFLEGKDIAHLEESDLAQIRGKIIGFVFQKFNLISTLTALENVMLPMAFQNIPSSERRKRAEGLLAQVALQDRMNHKPNELSGGQQQRVAIARSLAVNPDVILADEPTGNLDSASGDIVIELLCNLHSKQGKTVVMVTHNEFVARHAQKIYMLKDGAVVKTLKGNGPCPHKGGMK